MERNIIKLFEKVQKIPYKVCKFERDKIDENIRYGDCRHKSELLYKLLVKAGFEVKRLKVVFYWKNLPLPNKLLAIIGHDSVWEHDSLSVKINGRWTMVDCTWNLELKKKGFPVTEKWDGKSDTKLVTDGKLEFYDANKYIRKFKIKKDRSLRFADELNKWLSS